MYSFEEQINAQKEHFDAFVLWLQNRAAIDKVVHSNTEEDRAGIDLWVFCPERKSMQVKVDFWTATTGNIVYEIISQAHLDSPDFKIGWGLSLCSIDYFSYIVAGTGEIYIFSGKDLQHYILSQYRDFDNFSAQNKGYLTLGLIVPLSRISNLALFTGNILDLNACPLESKLC